MLGFWLATQLRQLLARPHLVELCERLAIQTLATQALVQAQALAQALALAQTLAWAVA